MFETVQNTCIFKNIKYIFEILVDVVNSGDVSLYNEEIFA